jgi:glyoxylase-like metal-dependent hydrolase (beta-lactamase superfamily II)
MNPIRSILTIILFCSLADCKVREEVVSNWCDRPLRPELAQLKEIPTKESWFKVYEVGSGVYAIAEPYNFQEVISYLIVGTEKSILFDTGMGMGKISEVVREITTLPVMVINSHTHYDHIGGNHEFNMILAVDTAYTRVHATSGWSHNQLMQEVRAGAFCDDMLPGFDTTAYVIRPYQERIQGSLYDGDTINLGSRTIEIMRVPGHTPDCIALLDYENGYLWTGDMFYEATIWLFFDGTDLAAYEKSINRFAELAPSLTKVFPAHNKPTADPAHLVELKDAFSKIMKGQARSRENPSSNHPDDKRALTFEFEHFSFLIRRDFLK